MFTEKRPEQRVRSQCTIPYAKRVFDKANACERPQEAASCWLVGGDSNDGALPQKERQVVLHFVMLVDDHLSDPPIVEVQMHPRILGLARQRDVKELV